MFTSLFHLQVLLPYVPEQSGVRTNFTLKSQNGCFQWYSVTCTNTHTHTHTRTHTHAHTHTPLPSPPLPSPPLTHTATGTQLRCDVFVDTIHKIEITTTTRELLLEEAPEMFDVRAFDEERKHTTQYCTFRCPLTPWVVLFDFQCILKHT